MQTEIRLRIYVLSVLFSALCKLHNAFMVTHDKTMTKNMLHFMNDNNVSACFDLFS